jgi:hypothetical protein
VTIFWPDITELNRDLVYIHYVYVTSFVSSDSYYVTFELEKSQNKILTERVKRILYQAVVIYKDNVLHGIYNYNDYLYHIFCVAICKMHDNKSSDCE